MTDGPAVIARRTLALYALPTVGLTAMQGFVLVLLLKYATDELGVVPMLIGTIFAVGRLWDAISDPLAGWLSDRTRSLGAR